jgi:transketolase
MILNDKNIKLFASIGARATFGLTALELVKSKKDLMILTSDVSTSAGLDRFRKTYSENYIEVGIAEQNLIGVAAGMASEGYDVITSTFSPFQALRCCEQIKVNLGYMKEKVTMVGLASGLVLGSLGFTHCSIEDVGVLRSIPNLTIISPADTGETAKCIYAAVEHKNSVYIRLTGGSNIKPVYLNDYNFEIGKAIKIVDGEDISIFATGSMVRNALDVAENLKKKQIFCSVINMHTIKPIDKKMIINECKKSKMIVSIEEHNIIGGLGSAIAEVKTQIKNSPPQILIGVEDKYSQGGSYTYLQKHFKLDPESIEDKIYEQFRQI